VIETRAPGKLFVAGEYAVVEPGGAAVVVAVDRFITVRATDNTQNTLTSAHYGREPLRWRRGRAGVDVAGGRPFDSVTAALDTVEAFAAASGRPERPLRIEIDSALDHVSGAKFGLGSSGAVVVATVRALGVAHHLELDDQAVLRLALLASWRAHPSGSGGDIAASTLGGWVEYRSGDARALLSGFERRGVGVLDDEWPGLSAVALPAPVGLDLLVGWTGSPASTSALVENSRLGRGGAAGEFRDFCAESDATVAALAAALRAGDDASVARAIRRARAALATHAALSGITIETPELVRLCAIAERHGAAAKSSGAGGGDCGIALAGPGVDRTALFAEWEAAGVRPLDLSVAG
jgi:phosphomevalonate kinase